MRQRKRKGLPGPRSGHVGRSESDATDLPVDRWDEVEGRLSAADFSDELPASPVVEAWTDPRTDPDTGVVDQKRPRRLRCENCYGQGQVPDSRFCGSARPCRKCGGTGKIEVEPLQPAASEPQQAAADDPDSFTLPRYHWEPEPQLGDSSDQAVLPVRPGDIDYDPEADQEVDDAALLQQPKPKQRRRLSLGKRKKPKKRKAKPKLPKASDIPPWELLPPGEV